MSPRLGGAVWSGEFTVLLARCAVETLTRGCQEHDQLVPRHEPESLLEFNGVTVLATQAHAAFMSALQFGYAKSVRGKVINPQRERTT